MHCWLGPDLNRSYPSAQTHCGHEATVSESLHPSEESSVQVKDEGALLTTAIGKRADSTGLLDVTGGFSLATGGLSPSVARNLRHKFFYNASHYEPTRQR